MFLLLRSPVTPRREVIVVVPLLLSFPLLGFAIRSYWRYWHDVNEGLSRVRLYFIAGVTGCSMKKTKRNAAYLFLNRQDPR